MRHYVRCLNEGKAPCIESVAMSVKRAQLESVVDKAVEVYSEVHFKHSYMTN